MTARATGQWGEALVADYLRANGYTILEMSYRCRYGEIDLIAQTGELLCFVEVKTRENTDMALPREYVTAAKQRRLRTTALFYLSSRGDCPRTRFDVAEVYTDTGHSEENTRIRYLEDAFI